MGLGPDLDADGARAGQIGVRLGYRHGSCAVLRCDSVVRVVFLKRDVKFGE